MNMYGAFPDAYKVTINGNHPLIGKLAKVQDENEKSNMSQQLFDLALLSQNLLKGKNLSDFVNRSLKWMES